MNVAIDLGNTRTKAALFNGTHLLEMEEGLPLEALPQWASERGAKAAIIGSVSAAAEALQAKIEKICPCLVLNPSLPVPLQKKYETPETLGADRLAASVGGWVYRKKHPVLVIDAGTCITYDFVDAEATYRGGAISPGLHMRLKALHNFTARLPLIDHVPEQNPLLGQSTGGSMLSGVVNGLSAEIEGMIRQFEADAGKADVLICGGDAKFFESKINRPIFVVPELVLIGLNEILRYNAPEI
ncbi:type III pantothenate kinase [Nafulsella turpanensis]|uniref:type III pantothenate kinase n=1 Tax=Nafulsella turpanensis TaxID=1265690 RepID=UPI0003466DCB|nr:type III pantothenate kinase [Nafulsella turpanensis]